MAFSLLAPPLILVLVFVLRQVPFFSGLFWYFFSIPIHEFGHAIMAWIGGRFALPIGAFIPMAGITFAFESRSFLFLISVLVGLGFLAWFGFRRHSLFILASAIGLIVSALFVGFSFSDSEWRELMTAGGLRGELVLSTYLMCAYFYELPKAWRWDFFRYPVFFAGAAAFLEAFSRWSHATLVTVEQMRGSFLGGAGDSGGDVDRLLSEFSWTMPRIISHHAKLSHLCVAALIVHYGYYVWHCFRAQSDGPSTRV